MASRCCRRDYFPKSIGDPGLLQNLEATTMGFATAGFTPASSVTSLRKAICFFPGARKICSRAGVTLSMPREIESMICNHPDFSKLPSSACPIRSGRGLESGARSSLIFVRTAVGLDSAEGLEFVELCHILRGQVEQCGGSRSDLRP